MEIKAITETDVLNPLKAAYLDQTTAPLDGMWLCGLLPSARHYGFYQAHSLVGYCCIDDDGFLLQFYLINIEQRSALLKSLIANQYNHLPRIKGAFVSTAEPDYLSVCFDNFSSFEVNALMYQFDGSLEQKVNNVNHWQLKLVKASELDSAVAFAAHSMGGSKDWLVSYYGNLISRSELFGCWCDGKLIGAGENRKFDQVQIGYTDVGVVVDPAQRGRGLATWILQQLKGQAQANGLKALCSTEIDNVGAQKAITRAGFISRNRIIQFKI